MSCHYVPAAARRMAWSCAYGEIPLGMRLGHTCDVPYCGRLDHMALTEDKTFKNKSWKEYANQIAALAPGESFDLPHYPRSMRGVIEFRAGVQMCNVCRHVKFIVRTLPSGGIRVIRTGDWNNEELATQVTAQFPVLMHREAAPCRSLRPGAFFLGFMAWNPRDVIESVAPACDIRGCPYPQVIGSLCRHHFRFFDFKFSMTDYRLDPTDIWSEEGRNNANLSIGFATCERHFRFRYKASVRSEYEIDNIDQELIGTEQIEIIKWSRAAFRNNCYYCGDALNRHNRTKDHFIPQAMGGSSYNTNLVSACWLCNQLKKSSRPEAFRYQYGPFFAESEYCKQATERAEVELGNRGAEADQQQA